MDDLPLLSRFINGGAAISTKFWVGAILDSDININRFIK